MLRRNIYIIIDRELILKSTKDLFEVTREILKGKPDFIQLRAKETPSKELLEIALKISKMVKRYKVKFLINDRVDIAKLAKAEGVHLGKDDLSPRYARKILGKGAFIGKTVHSLQEAYLSLKEPINYVSIGPIFKTSLKPQLKPLGIEKALKISSVFTNKKIMTFFIGGINLKRTSQLLKKGINNLVLCREVLLNKNPRNTIEALKELILN